MPNTSSTSRAVRGTARPRTVHATTARPAPRDNVGGTESTPQPQYVLYLGQGVFSVGAAETILAAGQQMTMITLTSYDGKKTLRVPEKKLPANTQKLPTIETLKRVEAILAGKSTTRPGNQNHAIAIYANCKSWDPEKMAHGVIGLRPCITSWPHSNPNAAQAIGEAMERIATLFHVVTSEDLIKAKQRLTELARAIPAAPPPTPEPAPRPPTRKHRSLGGGRGGRNPNAQRKPK